MAGLCAAVPLRAQEWRAGLQVGRISYEGSIDSVAHSSLALGISRAGLTSWLGATAGVPLEDQPFWGVAGGWKRLHAPGLSALALDVTGHGFVQRENGGRAEVLPPPVAVEASRSAEGVGGEAAVVGLASTGRLQLEVRAGAAGQSSRIAEETTSRLLPLADARVNVAVSAGQVVAEGRQWWAEEGSHAYLGGGVQWPLATALLWAHAGAWVAGGVDRGSWSAGVLLPLGDRLQLDGAYRARAFDPLYQSSTREAFALGFSVRIGGEAARGVRVPVPARYENGEATIRVAEGDVVGTPHIAGDFTGWEPRPMRREGGAWTFTVPLAPGVYHYAFVNDAGVWFVPTSVPGRQDDGMGGHVAVLVVQ